MKLLAVLGILMASLGSSGFAVVSDGNGVSEGVEMSESIGVSEGVEMSESIGVSEGVEMSESIGVSEAVYMNEAEKEVFSSEIRKFKSFGFPDLEYNVKKDDCYNWS